MDFADGRSPYEILGLEAGPEATPDDIKKVRAAARRAAAAARALPLRPLPGTPTPHLQQQRELGCCSGLARACHSVKHAAQQQGAHAAVPSKREQRAASSAVQRTQHNTPHHQTPAGLPPPRADQAS